MAELHEQAKGTLPPSANDIGLFGPLTSDLRAGHARFGARLRNWFLTGLIVVGPVSITLYIAWWFIAMVDGWVKPLIPVRYLPENYLPFTVPGLGLVVAVIALILIGALTANLFGRTVVSYGEDLLARMPIVRNVYRALKQIFETVLSKQGGAFKRVCVVEFPRLGQWSIGFVAGETMQHISDRTVGGAPLVSVFLPTTPNPTTGFLIFLAPEEVVEIDITVEEAAKLLISGGLIVPERQAQLKQLVDEAKAKRVLGEREDDPEPVA